MTRVLALAGQSKIGCITQRRFAKVGTKIHPQPGAALDRNGLSGSTETPCRFEPMMLGEQAVDVARHYFVRPAHCGSSGKRLSRRHDAPRDLALNARSI